MLEEFEVPWQREHVYIFSAAVTIVLYDVSLENKRAFTFFTVVKCNTFPFHLRSL